MIIFIIVGMPAAGKNIACEYAASNKYPYFSTGDIVRAEVRKRGIDPDAENTAVISTQMRGDDGLGVSRTVISEAIKRNAPVARPLKKAKIPLVIKFGQIFQKKTEDENQTYHCWLSN